MQTREDLPLWARAADAATIALLLLALFVALEGGFVFWPNGLRISVRSEWRPLGWALALLVARHLFVREAPIHRRFISKLDAAAKAPGPLPEDAPSVIEPGAPRPIRWTRVLAYTIYSALVVLLYAALTAVMTYPQVTRMSDTVAINDGDPLFSTWRLAWIAHQLPRDPAHLFNANIFYPERLTLAFSDSMLVPGLMAAPLLWLGVPQLVVYNIMLLSAFALSGATMFLLVRSLTRNSGAAFVAGFIFAFLPYRFMHYSHLELQVSHWMPLCLWALHRTIRHGRLSDGLLTGLFFALQSMSSWYYGIFLATFLIPIAAALLIGDGGRHLRASLRALTAGGALAAVLVLPAAAPYFSARESVGERPVEEIKFYSATPQNYLAAHPQNVLYGKATHRLGGQERELFLGFFVPVLALIGLWPRLSAPRIAYALGLVLAFELSLGLNGLLYPWLHAYALPYRGLRVPARMAMIVGLGLAVLAGYGVARVCRSPGRRRGSAALVAIFTMVVAVEYLLGSRAEARDPGSAARLRPHLGAAGRERGPGAPRTAAGRARHPVRADLHVLLDVPLVQARERLQRVQSAVVSAPDRGGRQPARAGGARRTEAPLRHPRRRPQPVLRPGRLRPRGRDAGFQSGIRVRDVDPARSPRYPALHLHRPVAIATHRQKCERPGQRPGLSRTYQAGSAVVSASSPSTRRSRPCPRSSCR